MVERHYLEVLSDIKQKIKAARQRAILSVNNQLLELYWSIGNTILIQQKNAGWGAKVIDKLAADLKIEFPDMKGFSVRNLKYMRAFAAAYPQFVQGGSAQIKSGKKKTKQSIVQGELAQLSWYHHITLLEKIKDADSRTYYLSKAIENGWTRDVMLYHIDNELHKRQGKAITNFEQTLPEAQSKIANEALKNPYLFDFLDIGEEMQERELEKALVGHIRNFLLELGRGFAFVGNQYNLKVEKEDFYLDLLFYNFHLHSFVIFELKIGEFKPEFAGKLNFYVNAIDEQIKSEYDSPTIGVLLCKTPNKTVIKYTLKGITAPLGVTDYQLPQKIKKELPSLKELETVLEVENSKKRKKPKEKKKS